MPAVVPAVPLTYATHLNLSTTGQEVFLMFYAPDPSRTAEEGDVPADCVGRIALTTDNFLRVAALVAAAASDLSAETEDEK